MSNPKEVNRGTKIPNVMYEGVELVHGSDAYEFRKEWNKKKGSAKTEAKKILDDHIEHCRIAAEDLAKKYGPKEPK